jgi:hypothetical protein
MSHSKDVVFGIGRLDEGPFGVILTSKDGATAVIAASSECRKDAW